MRLAADGDHGRLGLARGTPRWALMGGAAAAPATAYALRARAGRRRAALVLAAIGAAACAFFRDPEREVGPGALLAPADGVISLVAPQVDGRVRVATFMRLRDVHVNRAPIDGVVRELRHRPGRHRPAMRRDADANERLEWTIDTALGELRLIQIAGSVAQRIIPYRTPGQRVERGQRIGMIRFGSRVDVILPRGISAGVGVGQRVRAGRTRLDRNGPAERLS